MDDKLWKRIAAVTAKRPRTVLNHILKHGQVTTDELRELYGYDHAPRAARDVRECGVRLLTVMIRAEDGRRMATYKIDERTDAEAALTQGRRAFPKALKGTLVARDGEQCALCGGHFPARALQVDHRIPYEVAGDADAPDPDDFMLVCGSCNRAKSWSCEHCPNWIAKESDICASCMWASPDAYKHVATEPRRRLDVTWEGDEAGEYDEVAAQAVREGEDVRAVVKRIIRQKLHGDPKDRSVEGKRARRRRSRRKRTGTRRSQRLRRST